MYLIENLFIFSDIFNVMLFIKYSKFNAINLGSVHVILAVSHRLEVIAMFKLTYSNTLG